MTEPLAFLNGNLLPQSAASIALNDAGFIFGATITDLCRTFRHRLSRWEDHLARFRQSCQLAQIGLRMSDAKISHRAQELVAHNASLIYEHHDLALVLFATPGPIGYYLGQRAEVGDDPTFGMHTFPLPFTRYRPWIEQGVYLITPSVRQIPAAGIDPHIKHRSRLHWWLAQHQAGRDAQALLLGLNGHVTETASANFLLISDGTVVSPPREAILGGISLQMVTELCGRLGIPMVHRPISLDDCYAADEALLTCTSYCLAGARQINDRVLRWPGPMLQRLLEAWNAEVGLDIHAQIMAG
jgi:branched-subunit amino acid aminotransferase/4-amino-4-deoxychorismate lyase